MKRKFRFSIRAKTIIMIVVSALILVETAVAYFAIVTNKTSQEDFKKLATSLSNTVAVVIDSDKVVNLKNQIKSIYDASENKPTSEEWGSDEWNDYIAQFDEVAASAEYIEMRDYLREIASAYSNEVDCIYLSFVDDVNSLFVYIADSAPDEDACPPGCIDVIYDVNKEVVTNPERGFPVYITNTAEYGWLATAGAPIFAGDEVVAYAMVDISMGAVRFSIADEIIRLTVYMFVTVVLIAIIGLIIVHFLFAKPIRKLNSAASSYDKLNPENTHILFTNLKVNTHDEISDLAESMKKMENDVYTKISELTKVNAELVASQEETKKMEELANKDALTGVYNKIAYNSAVEEINNEIANGGRRVRFGLVMIDLNYLKSINDDYGHDAGDNALIKLTEFIVTSFAGSPVYRIGGDEFVVILRGKNYTNAEKLIDVFNKKIEEEYKNKDLPDAERTSAALGYSSFDPENDKCVDDVFKRADKAMYARKHRMKTKDN